jgi:AAA domain-containing protein
VVGQLTEHRKDFRRSDALAALLDAVPVIDTMAHAQDLVDQVLAQHDLVAQLPEQGQTHLTHHERYTSTAIVQAERTIVESAAARHGEGAALVPADAAAMAVGVFEAEAGFALSGEQRAAVDRLLTGGHGIDALIGVAGSGKTTLMSAARTGWSAAGLVVAGASTAAVAAVNLEAESGITSATLASWLMRIRHGQGLTGVDVMVLDEAAMCDDRQVAELTAAAAATGTKLVMIGDPMQLRSPGVGGSFNAVHTIVGGRVLRENRRQRDQDERAALARWRTGDRLGALLDWSAAGRVHVAEDGPTAIAAMLQRWDQARAQTPDPFERIAATLLLAGTNADVDKLNAGARAIRIAAGEIEAGREYRRAGGGRIEISVGDVVMTRANDYRQRKTRGAQMDVLNGYRGIVTAVTERGITVAWKDGTESELTTRYIAEGGVSHGYALTVAKSQGLTAQDAIVYGAGLDPNTLYPAMSRDRGRVDLVLPRTVLEDADTLARLGEPASEAEALRRAINAYAASLTSREEPMVSVELGQPLPTVPAVEATRADQAEAEQQPARRTPRAAARSTPATRRPVPAEQQAEAQAAPVADPEAADAIRTAAQAVSGTPSERLAASINRAQSRRTRRAEARAARPRPPANRVPATAEQVRARAARAEDDRADWPVMFTAPFGTTKAADLAAETERAGHELESWEYRERAAAAVLDAAAAGHPGRAETQLLAERVGHRERADLIAAVHRAEQQLAQAERQVEAADRETARLQAQRGERGNSVRTALRGPAAWRERDEALIAAQTERREAADRVTAAEGALRDAVAASPALSPHNPLEIRRRYWERLTTETAQFEANLPRALVAARANDTETLMRAREQGPEAHRQAEAWRARLDTLQGEAARRAALPEAERAIEDGLRGLRTVNARLLDTARAALAAADQAPEGYRPWTARTYGPLTPAGLDEREQQLRERAGEFADQGAALRERMRQEDQAVREGQGPAATRLRQGGEAARVRAERDEAADPIRAREAAAAQAAEHVQGQIQRLREQLHEHGAPWWMLNHATTPRTVRELIEQQLQPQLERHVAARDAVRAELEALPGGHPGPAGEGREALRRYTEQLPAAEQAALARDRDRLDTAHRPLRTQAEQADHAEAATRGDLAALTAERNLRAELPTALSRAENTARSTRIGERRADARAEAAAREQYQAELTAWREQYPQEARQQETEHHHHYEAPDPGLGHGLSR